MLHEGLRIDMDLEIRHRTRVTGYRWRCGRVRNDIADCDSVIEWTTVKPFHDELLKIAQTKISGWDDCWLPKPRQAELPQKWTYVKAAIVLQNSKDGLRRSFREKSRQATIADRCVLQRATGITGEFITSLGVWSRRVVAVS